MSFINCGVKLIINARPPDGSPSLPIYCRLIDNDIYAKTGMVDCGAYDCSVIPCKACISKTTTCPYCGKDLNSKEHPIPLCDEFNCECGCRVMTCHGAVIGYASHRLTGIKGDDVI